MITLTIGYVSGIIAAAIFVLQFVVPNALIIILVGILKNNHTAVTWSVVERNLLSSHWPLLLRADSTASRGVDRSIRLLTWLRPLALALITISAIVTPLGLYDDVLPERSQQSLRMVYVPDTGPFGFGTPPRDPQYFSRKCGDVLPLQCPGTTTDITYEIEEVDGEMYSANASWDDIDLRIPKVLAELYQSGLKDQPGSVSSFFDIQTRQYGYSQQSGAMQNKTYLVDGFQYLSTVILNDAIEPFEGLIVDTKSGSIGFRNHTVPDGAGLGAEWSEDLLFIVSLKSTFESLYHWVGQSCPARKDTRRPPCHHTSLFPCMETFTDTFKGARDRMRIDERVARISRAHAGIVRDWPRQHHPC